MQEYYKILGVSENATDEEIEAAYSRLKQKYSNERFYEGEVGNEAAKKLTKLETAYNEIKSSRKHFDSEGVHYDFSDIERLIKEGKISDAQARLDDFTDRNAEWHYLQSVIFYKKNWINESKKQLEIAMNMDPHNSKYAESYTKLRQKIDYADRQFHSGNVGGAQGGTASMNEQPQMGGSACGTMADCCTTWCCMNMLCNMCCR